MCKIYDVLLLLSNPVRYYLCVLLLILIHHKYFITITSVNIRRPEPFRNLEKIRCNIMY